MPWNAAAAQKRIDELIAEVPDFSVQKFDEYLPLYEARRKADLALNRQVSPPLFSLDRGEAVVVNTVQIYASIVDYETFRLEEGIETEASHKRALSLLHFIYSAADRLIENSPAQRVDFHSGRVHSVVLERSNSGVSRESLGEALAFVEDFRALAQLANQELAGGEFDVQLCIGVDAGTCVAINNGTGIEQEPMFLGSAANHAAKLASRNESGVFVSDRARKLLALPDYPTRDGFSFLTEDEIALNTARRGVGDQLVFGVDGRDRVPAEIVANWRKEIREGAVPEITNPDFRFSHKTPPLSDINYRELSPSKSIRMDLVSMFGDLSGFTTYVDQAVQEGGIRDVVRALYVIREEFQNVVELDFGGRKVRFVGDCIHALIAEGSSHQTDERKSVATAAQCAGGLRSSFALCKQTLDGLDDLGLAVGLELGPTPVSRIGIQGDRSVRVASSVATSMSEKMQSDCEHDGIKFGPKALQTGPVALKDLLEESGFQTGLGFDDFAESLSDASQTTPAPYYARAHSPKELSTERAHLRW